MSSLRLTAVVIVPVMFSIGGCSATPDFDSKFGYAVNAAKAQQTINRDAALNTDPVAGIDGTPAKHSIDRYHDTFKAPPPSFEIFLGGSSVQSR